MAADYDAPRATGDSIDAESIEELKARRSAAVADQGGDLDVGDDEPLDLPGADLPDEELVVRVLPRQPDEFTCTQCFLVHHRSRLARRQDGMVLCTDCG